MSDRVRPFPPVLWVVGALLLLVYGMAFSRSAAIAPSDATPAPPSNPAPVILEDPS